VVALYEHARLIAAIDYELGEAQVGGASDGNFAAAIGAPVLTVSESMVMAHMRCMNMSGSMISLAAVPLSQRGEFGIERVTR